VNRIQIMPFGSAATEAIVDLCVGLQREFAVRCEILPPEPAPDFAFNPARQQYSSTEILATMIKRAGREGERILAVTPLDLYIPILTFVFGEAQLPGSCALVSYHRLRQEFYGLPRDSKLLRERLLKESIHELGHTLSLSHCEDYQCVMSPSHGVERIDLKSSHYCNACLALVPVLSASNAST